MKVNPMAIIVPANLAAGGENELRAAVWETVTELLLPKLGKYFSRFEPARFAWKQRLEQPYGIVFGKKDPALFLYYYMSAKALQQEMVQRHMVAFLENLEPLGKSENNGLAVYAMGVKGDGQELGAHLSWHLAMITGELQPDAGVYFAEDKESFVTDKLDKKVLDNLERYALCVVNLVGMEETP
jgi:hypothetical protein